MKAGILSRIAKAEAAAERLKQEEERQMKLLLGCVTEHEAEHGSLEPYPIEEEDGLLRLESITDDELLGFAKWALIGGGRYPEG